MKISEGPLVVPLRHWPQYVHDDINVIYVGTVGIWRYFG